MTETAATRWEGFVPEIAVYIGFVVYLVGPQGLRSVLFGIYAVIYAANRLVFKILREVATPQVPNATNGSGPNAG